MKLTIMCLLVCKRWLGQFMADRRGIAAVEFGLIASVLCVAGVGMADIGMAISQRAAMDQAIRAGAQAAMARYDDDNDIRTVVLDAAGSAAGNMTASVQRFCRCPGAITTVSCSTLCTGDIAPSIFVKIAATYQHDAMLLPDRTLQASTEIQLR